MEQISNVNWWQPRSPEPAAFEQPIAHAASAAPTLPFVGLAVFSFVLFVAPQDLITALAPFRLALVAGLVAVFAQLASRTGRATALAFTPREFGIAGALLAWGVLTIPLSLWPGGSVAVLTDRLLKSLIVFWLIGVSVTTVPRLRQLCWMLTIFSVPIAATALLHYATGTVDGTGRIIGYGNGLAANPNDLALMLDIVMPLTVSLALSAESRFARFLAMGMVLIDAAAVVVTFSRGGFLGMAVVMMWFLWRRTVRAPLQTALAAVIVLGIALPLLPPGFGDRLATVTNIDTDRTSSAQERWRDTKLAAMYVETHPIVGAGLGNDILVLNELRGPTWRSVHNAYLNYGVDLGVPGLVLFVWLVARSIRSARRHERRPAFTPAGREFKTLAGGVAAGLMAFAIAAFFYPVGYQFYFFYLAGLAAALTHIAQARPAQ